MAGDTDFERVKEHLRKILKQLREQDADEPTRKEAAE